jgi:hypothetical protein
VVVAALLVTAILAVAGCSSSPQAEPAASRAAVAAADTGPPWASGVWLGGVVDAARVAEFGRWRGSPADTLTVYPAYATWRELAASDWNVSTFEGYPGRLVYGLPLLPSDQSATLADVAAGRYDDIWRAVAGQLSDNGREDSFVRVGLEANGTWFPWGATARTAGDFKAAYRRVATLLSRAVPDLTFVFDISCGVALEGDDNRLASLERLYPGDDVVDVVGCDHYDSYSAIARNDAEWADAIAPKAGPGLADVAAFARDRGKQLAVPEWGLSAPRSEGAGDNPFFIRRMYEYFEENQDVLAFENYFDEPNPYLGSALFLKPQNPRSARVYRELW